MENQKTSSTQIMLNYGLILGFVGILINVAVFAMGQTYDPHWSVSVIGIIVTVLIIVAAIKKFKAGSDGYLSLGQALKIGLGTALVAAILGIIYTYIFANFIEPDYYARVIEVQQAAVLEKYPNFTDEQIEMANANIERFAGFGMGATMALVVSLFFGFIVALIAGLIMKKSKEE
jgi:hypothetical protein